MTIQAGQTYNPQIEPLSMTYVQLVALSGGYIVGMKYTISDYATIYNQPVSGVGMVGVTEPLTITAISTTEFDPIATSALYPKDIIYYNINNATLSATVKGYIYRRIDTLRNVDIPFDYRNVKFRRYSSDMSSVGLGTGYYLWATSVTIGYDYTLNATRTFTGNSADYVDYYQWCNSATPNIGNVRQIPYFAHLSAATWNLADYNNVFRCTDAHNITFGDFTWKNTVILNGGTVGMHNIYGGNMHENVVIPTSSIWNWLLIGKYYDGLTLSVLGTSLSGSGITGCVFNGASNLCIRAGRTGELEFYNCQKIEIVAQYAHYFFMREFIGLGIGSTNAANYWFGKVRMIQPQYDNVTSVAPVINYAGLLLDIANADQVSGTNQVKLIVDAEQSNIIFPYVITGLTDINFTYNKASLIKQAWITSGNAAENVLTFTNSPKLVEFDIVPKGGLTLTITAGAAMFLGAGVATIVLVAANGDFARFRWNKTLLRNELLILRNY